MRADALAARAAADSPQQRVDHRLQTCSAALTSARPSWQSTLTVPWIAGRQCERDYDALPAGGR